MNLKPFKDSEIKKAAVSLACFHGETWYKCPWCGKTLNILMLFMSVRE